MKKAAGFITLHRQIMDWEWYRHPHTAFLFIHLLLSANFTDGVFQGRTIRRGQLVTSVPQLSTYTGLSIQTTKTALAHLRLTGEITDEANRQYRIITITKYDDYQKLTYKPSNDQPTTNLQKRQRLTDERSNDQPQYNNINKETNKQDNNNPPLRSDEHQTAFNIFWETYPKKVAKQAALKAWKKIDHDRETYHAIMRGLSRWKESDEWNRDGGRFIPHPASWLNGRRWEDDVPASEPEERKPQTKTVIAQQYSQRDYKNEQMDAMLRMIEGGA